MLVLVGAGLAPLGVGSALAGPADASCVYLAQGCREPTLRPLIPLLSTDLPANNPGQAMPPAPPFPAPIVVMGIGRSFGSQRGRGAPRAPKRSSSR